MLRLVPIVKPFDKALFLWDFGDVGTSMGIFSSSEKAHTRQSSHLWLAFICRFYVYFLYQCHHMPPMLHRSYARRRARSLFERLGVLGSAKVCTGAGFVGCAVVFRWSEPMAGFGDHPLCCHALGIYARHKRAEERVCPALQRIGAIGWVVKGTGIYCGACWTWGLRGRVRGSMCLFSFVHPNFFLFALFCRACLVQVLLLTGVERTGVRI